MTILRIILSVTLVLLGAGWTVRTYLADQHEELHLVLEPRRVDQVETWDRLDQLKKDIIAFFESSDLDVDRTPTGFILNTNRPNVSLVEDWVLNRNDLESQRYEIMRQQILNQKQWRQQQTERYLQREAELKALQETLRTHLEEAMMPSHPSEDESNLGLTQPKPIDALPNSTATQTTITRPTARVSPQIANATSSNLQQKKLTVADNLRLAVEPGSEVANKFDSSDNIKLDVELINHSEDKLITTTESLSVDEPTPPSQTSPEDILSEEENVIGSNSTFGFSLKREGQREYLESSLMEMQKSLSREVERAHQSTEDSLRRLDRSLAVIHKTVDAEHRERLAQHEERLLQLFDTQLQELRHLKVQHVDRQQRHWLEQWRSEAFQLEKERQALSSSPLALPSQVHIDLRKNKSEPSLMAWRGAFRFFLFGLVLCFVFNLLWEVVIQREGI